MHASRTWNEFKFHKTDQKDDNILAYQIVYRSAHFLSFMVLTVSFLDKRRQMEWGQINSSYFPLANITSNYYQNYYFGTKKVLFAHKI